MMLTGTLVNAGTILLGSLLGLLLGKRFPEHLSDAVTKGLALCVFYIGADGLFDGENTLITIISIVIGCMIGELADLDKRLHDLGARIEARFRSSGGKTSLSEGFVSATLLFCVGAMAITGALDGGLRGDHATLYAKSALDFVASMIFATTLGIGVALSAVSVFLYQGIIAVCASFAAPYLAPVVVAEMKCVGSLLLIGLSFNMLGITRLKIMNYVPAVFLPILLCLFM